MGKIGEGRKTTKASNVEHATETTTEPVTATNQPIEIPRNADGSIDFAAMYDRVDAQKQPKQNENHAGATSAQIREVIDGLFSTGKYPDGIKVATVEGTVNLAFGLSKDAKNLVQNSTVRSAGTAGGKYKIVNHNGAATFQVNPDYDASKDKTRA